MPIREGAARPRSSFFTANFFFGLAAALAAFAALSGCSSHQAPNSYRARFETSKGDFVIEVTRSWAPLGADRFYELIRSGFYDNSRFFRVRPGFVVQFGVAADPAVTRKWKDAKIKDDPVAQSNRRGTVSFATAGPETRTTQVFINLVDNTKLDSQGFSPFGTVVSGMDAVDQFYSGYGEMSLTGNGLSPVRLEAEGNAYAEREFPKLDYIKKATIVQ